MAPLTERMGRSLSSAIVVRRAVGLDLVFEVADLGGAGGENDVLRGDGVDDVGRGEAFGLERGQVEIHLHLALLAAIGIGNAGALYRDQLGADEVEAEVVQLLFGEALPGEAELKDGHAGGGVLDDERRRWFPAAAGATESARRR